MIKTWILVMVISNGYKSGVTSTHIEFNSQDQCLKVLNSVIIDTNKTDQTRVVSGGCYEK